MRNFIKCKDGVVGFGSNTREAEDDLYLNTCIRDIGKDTRHLYSNRRCEWNPWLPLPNVLHIRGIGCLYYHDGVLTETKSGTDVVIGDKGAGLYYYMSRLFGKQLSFSDISVVLHKELDTFFKGISKDFWLIEEFPPIQLVTSENDFVPEVTYKFSDGLELCCNTDLVGVRKDENFFYAVERAGGTPMYQLMSYVCYKVGFVFVGEEVVRIGR